MAKPQRSLDEGAKTEQRAPARPNASNYVGRGQVTNEALSPAQASPSATAAPKPPSPAKTAFTRPIPDRNGEKSAFRRKNERTPPPRALSRLNQADSPHNERCRRLGGRNTRHAPAPGFSRFHRSLEAGREGTAMGRLDFPHRASFRRDLEPRRTLPHRIARLPPAPGFGGTPGNSPD